MFKLRIAVQALLVSTIMASAASVAQANDVSIYIDDSAWYSVLVLEGDDDPNSIEISHLFSDYHLIRGRDGTTIDGRSSVVLPISIKLRIITHDGDDVVNVLSSSLDEGMHLFPGNDNDTVSVANSRFATLLVADTSGDDTVLIDDVETNSIFGRVTVEAGSGEDFVSILSSDVGSISASADSLCTFSISHNIVRFIVEIEGAARASSIIHFYGNDCASLFVDTGDFRDDVNVVGNQISNSFDYSRIMTGSGSDIVWFQHNTHFAFAFGKAIVINTGQGTDQGRIRKSFATDKVSVFQFEGSFK